jgi:MraZ protein
MAVFAGTHDRTIDSKGRIQLPAQFRAEIDEKIDGKGIYLQLGEIPQTLSLYTVRELREIAQRARTKFTPGIELRRFEAQFWGSASLVEIDSQGRFVIPEKLRKKARLGEEVYLVGADYRIDIWNRSHFERDAGIDWEGEGWPDWQHILHQPPLPARDDLQR